jgi:DNA-directed RNA polymerase subunit RPC12/RpoP
MKDPTSRSFLCPCCSNILYSLEPDEKTGRWLPTDESPALRHDQHGPFIRCPRCSRRVGIVLSPEHADEPFFVAAAQDCRRMVTD